MPMFKALEACPDAVVIRPDMEKYRRVGREVRAADAGADARSSSRSRSTRPSSTSPAPSACTMRSPAMTLARFARRVEDEIGITVSVGLSLQQVPGQDRLRPRQAARLLGHRPGRGRGASSPTSPSPSSRASALRRRRGWRSSASPICATCAARRSPISPGCSGAKPPSWSGFARGEDARPRAPGARRRRASRPRPPSTPTCAASTSCEPILWRLCREGVAAAEGGRPCRRQRRPQAQGRGVPAAHPHRARACRRRSLPAGSSTRRASCCRAACDGTAFRLIGIGAADLCDAAEADRGDLADPEVRARRKARGAPSTVCATSSAEAAVQRGLALQSASRLASVIRLSADRRVVRVVPSARTGRGRPSGAKSP